MPLTPISDRIIVRPDEPERRIGNIILPDRAVKKTLRGTVLAAGPGKADGDGNRVPPDVKEGDRVILREWSGQEVEHGGEKLYVVFAHEVLAVVESED